MKLDVIYNEDWLVGAIKLQNGSIPLVVTDPPYNIGKKYGSKTNDNRPETEYWDWFEKVFRQVWRVMMEGYLYMSHSDRGVYEAKPILENIGFDYIQTLIWWGKNGYSMQLHRKSWSYRHEPILFMQKGNPSVLEFGEKGMWYTSVLDVPRPQSNFKEGRFHPTQKPVKLYRNLIQRTPGNIVLDPFIGSGTTAIACIGLGRHYIGFDIESKNCEISKKRLSQVQLELIK